MVSGFGGPDKQQPISGLEGDRKLAAAGTGR